MLATTSAKTESQFDKNSFWYGWAAGCGSTLCQLAKDGMIPKGYAAKYMQVTLEEVEADPDIAPFKQEFLNAYKGLKENPKCAGVFK